MTLCQVLNRWAHQSLLHLWGEIPTQNLQCVLWCPLCGVWVWRGCRWGTALLLAKSETLCQGWREPSLSISPLASDLLFFISLACGPNLPTFNDALLWPKLRRSVSLLLLASFPHCGMDLLLEYITGSKPFFLNTAGKILDSSSRKRIWQDPVSHSTYCVSFLCAWILSLCCDEHPVM